MMRSLCDVIDSILQIAPDLGDQGLNDLKSSAQYAAPELQHLWWGECQEWLADNASGHPMENEIKKIWNGE